MTTQLYSGTRVSTTSEIFQNARETLFNLTQLTTEAEVCILDFADDNSGKITYKLLAPTDVAVKRDGVAVAATTTVSNYNIYVIETLLTETKNSLNLTFERNGKTYSYVQTLGGKAVKVTAEECVVGDFTKETVMPTFTLIDGATVDAMLGGKVAKIDLPATSTETLQAFRISGKLVQAIGESASKYVMRIYYTGEEETELVISAKHKKAMIYYDLATVTLKKGLNEIEVPLAAKNWATLGDIEYLALYVGGRNGETARSLYFVESVTYNK